MKISHHPPKNKTSHSGHMCISLKLTKGFYTRHPFTKLHFSASFSWATNYIQSSHPYMQIIPAGGTEPRGNQHRKSGGRQRAGSGSRAGKDQPGHPGNEDDTTAQMKWTANPKGIRVPPSFSPTQQDCSLCNPNSERTPHQSKPLLVATASRYSRQAVWFYF